MKAIVKPLSDWLEAGIVPKTIGRRTHDVAARVRCGIMHEASEKLPHSRGGPPATSQNAGAAPGT